LTNDDVPFHATSPSARYTLSLHDALPIFGEGDFFGQPFNPMPDQRLFLYRWYEYCPQCDQWRFKEALRMEATGGGKTQFVAVIRSEEHTSELQSRENLVCRLLLEKKNS